jgi:cytochrome c oxidase accessory protein FixG
MSGFLESPEEVLSTLGKDGKRKWLYPKLVKGFWYHRRRALAYALILGYIVAPFISIGGKPLILLDIVNRKFTFFGESFIASDNVPLLFLVLSLVLIIVTASAYFGRLWCGWACPQTVYLEFVFRPIEELIEGSPSRRKKTDLAPNSFNKLWRKALKFFVFGIIAFILANAFLAYFVGAKELISWMQMSPAKHPEPFIIMVAATAAVLFDFGYFREQMCTIACPYARLQSVLLDRHSVVVGYDENRGEPRGAGRDRDDKGDCVSCNLCVAVCPMGIDIRKGLQLECIHCTQCVDACDSIMSKVGKPAGLIRYASTEAFAGGKTQFFRARTILYTVLLTAFIGMLVFSVSSRKGAEVQLLRRNATPYVVRDDGFITNHLRVKIINRTGSEKHYSLSVESDAKLEILIPQNPILIKKGDGGVANIFTSIPGDKLLAGKQSGQILVDDGKSFKQRVPFTLIGPNNKAK